MEENQDFQPVTFQKEREKILSDLQTKSVAMVGLTDDFAELYLKVKRIEDSSLILEVTTPPRRALKKGELLQMLFGLPEGQFLMRAKVDDITSNEIKVASRSELGKLQRRNNFRAKVPGGSSISFKVSSFKNVVVTKIALSPLDLSAGGARFKWISEGLPVPVQGDQISGVLVLPQGRQLEIFGTIRNIAPTPAGLQVGVEFQNLAVRDEQALLFACMQLQRSQAAIE